MFQPLRTVSSFTRLVLFQCLLSAVQLSAVLCNQLPDRADPATHVAGHQHVAWSSPCQRSSGRFHRRPRSPLPDEPFEYAVVIDAGSSGSRIRVYRWPTPPVGVRVALQATGVEQTFNKKIEPGLSARSADLEELALDVAGLLNNASVHVPERLKRRTPVYVMATAGMRLLLEDRTNYVMRYVDSLMRNSTFNPFLYRRHSTRILSGEEEGVFAWIAVNYLVGAFNVASQQDEVRPSLVGILELGGASTQIAFEPEGNIMAAKFPVLIGGWRYQLYVHSYLHYGQNAIDRRVKEILIAENEAASPDELITDPCMLLGDTTTHFELNRSFIGSGNPTECRGLLERLVYKVEASKCHTKPCGIGSFYQPTISPNMTFYAVGSFRWTLKSIGALTEDGIYVPRAGFEAAAQFCTKSLDTHLQTAVNAGSDPKHLKYMRSKCLVGLYTAILFTRGYGFSNDTRQIYAVSEMNKLPLDWTLGAVLYEDELDAIYSCGLMTNNDRPSSPNVGEVKSSTDSSSTAFYRTGSLLSAVFVVLLSAILTLCQH